MIGQDALLIIDRLLEQNRHKALKDIQVAIVLHVWDGISYQVIAKKLGYEPDYVRQVAAQLWQVLSGIVGTKVTKSNLRSILQRYQTPCTTTDWGEAIDVSHFYGRQSDLQRLQDWALGKRCRVVGIFGWGGIGKTALSVKFAQMVEGQFEYVVWRSLQKAPTPCELLDDILSVLSGSTIQYSATVTGINQAIALLMQQLHQKRCLLVLDNVESILQPSHQNGDYLRGYEAYGQIFERISDVCHQSCLLITGREKPQSLTLRTGENLPVQFLHLSQLPLQDAQQILMNKGITASVLEQHSLIHHVDGNPLALSIVATTIQKLFNGDIPAFLCQSTTVFGILWALFDQQFERLTVLQQRVMYSLAINRDRVTPNEMQTKLFPSVTLSALLEALEALHDRSLIQSTERGLTLQPIVMEYVTEKFMQQIEHEIMTGEINLVKTTALVQVQAQNDCNSGQMSWTYSKLILQSLVDRLLTHYETQAHLEQHLYQLLVSLRCRSSIVTGYAGENLLNLLIYLRVDLQHFSVSGISTDRVNLSKAKLPRISSPAQSARSTALAKTFGNVVGLTFSPNSQYFSYDLTLKKWTSQISLPRVI